MNLHWIGRRAALAVVACLVGAGLLVGCGDDSDGAGSGMDAPRGTVPEEAAPGTRVDVTVLVTRLAGPAVVEVTVLEAAGPDTYRRSDTTTTVSWDDDVQVAMGDLAEVREGAVLAVSGSTRAGGEIRADELTVLTDFVDVE